MRQFCQPRTDCCFGADWTCVYCGRKASKSEADEENRTGIEIGNGLNESVEPDDAELFA